MRVDRAAAAAVFTEWLHGLEQGTRGRIHILTDSDADGVPAAALLVRALRRAGYLNVTAEARRKYENAWLPEVIARLRDRAPEALMVVDLGARPGELLPGVPALLVDHHAPFGTPPGATLLSAYGDAEPATSGLLAYWCACAIAPEMESEGLWLAGMSLLSDLGDAAPFPELAAAKKQAGVTALKELTSLVNAPRRTASGDASAALKLLIEGESAKAILKGGTPELAELRAAKAEVSAALAEARKARPYFSRKWVDALAEIVAVPVHTPVQVHPLVAQTWRQRFPRSVIFGVNTGFRPSFVHFAGRAPRGVKLVSFLRAHAPEGSDASSFGGGHDQAAGGALATAVWNVFAQEMGFGPELQVTEAAGGGAAESILTAAE